MKHHVIVILILNGVLISDQDENTIDNGKHVALFHLSKYSDQLHGNIVFKIQIEMGNSFKHQLYLYFLQFQTFHLHHFLGSAYIN